MARGAEKARGDRGRGVVREGAKVGARGRDVCGMRDRQEIAPDLNHFLMSDK